MPEGLLDAVKIYLDITWNDTNTDTKITGIINRGIKFLDDKAGATLDYTEEDRPRELLMEYCKYARGGILNEFIENYAPFIMDLRIKNGGAYGETTTI